MAKLNSNGTIYVTEAIYSKSQAISRKMKAVQPEIFGIKLVKYETLSERKVFIPYSFLKFEYTVRNSIIKSNNELFKRKGIAYAVCDRNAIHTALYDMADGEISMLAVPANTIEEDQILSSCLDEEMYKSVENSLVRHVLRRAYKANIELKHIDQTEFYREAWELELAFKGVPHIKYAYLDNYGINNERIASAKAILD